MKFVIILIFGMMAAKAFASGSDDSKYDATKKALRAPSSTPLFSSPLVNVYRFNDKVNGVMMNCYFTEAAGVRFMDSAGPVTCYTGKGQ